MIKLNDGRNELWQWDTGRVLTVTEECDIMHFANLMYGNAIPVQVVDGLVNIPDELLQTGADLICWCFIGNPENGYTKLTKTFEVNKKPKPNDYVFTPTEQITIKDLIQRVEAAEDYVSPENIQTRIDDALLEAKESGEFDGEDGKDGKDGKDGYTPQKGIDYFDGKDGKDGLNGKDGYTPQKGIDYFDGKDGKDGKSAYESWLDQGNTGTEAEFVDSLSVQSDLAETDPTSAAYIKHSEGYGYLDKKIEVDTIVPEASIEIKDTTAYYTGDKDSPIWIDPLSLENGHTYKVLFDGVEYACNAVVDTTNKMAMLGNRSIIDSSQADTGESFAYILLSEGDIDGGSPVIVISFKARGKTVTFSIYEKTEVTEATKFDGRLMPNGLGYLEGEDSITVTDTLTFNGDMTDKVNFTLDGNNYFVNITDSPVEISLLYGATVEAYGQQITITEDICQDMSAQVGVPCYFAGDYVVICYEDSFFMGFDFPKGIYVTNTPNAGYVSSIKALTDCFTVETKAIPHLIDERLIGDWVARKKLGTVELLPEITFEWVFNEDSGDYNYLLNQPILLEIGKEYKVVLNGNTYQCIGTDMSSQIPNACALDVGGQLWVISNGASTGLEAGEINTTEPTTIAIYAEGEVPDKMPEEYLPENITASEVVLTSPSGKKFSLTVDDSGNLTATEVTE